MEKVLHSICNMGTLGLQPSGQWPLGPGVYISGRPLVPMLQILNVPLCVSGSKGKTGIQLKYILEKRDTFEMYPRKFMHIIGG